MIWGEWVVNELYFWFGLDCRWDIIVLFLWYLYQALWLDLRGVCVDRVRLCFEYESERRVCCSLSESVVWIWILGFDIGDFWDCFYWSRSGMDRGVYRKVASNDFWNIFGVFFCFLDYERNYGWVSIWIFRRVSWVELL